MNNKLIPLVTWRGKCVDNGMLVTGRLEPYYDSADVFDGYYIHSSYFKYRVIPESLAIFTGLYDANGTPIFSSVGEFRGGDVAEGVFRLDNRMLSDFRAMSDNYRVTGEIIYDTLKASCYFRSRFKIDYLGWDETYRSGKKKKIRVARTSSPDSSLGKVVHMLTVIGNAYANPELVVTEGIVSTG